MGYIYCSIIFGIGQTEPINLLKNSDLGGKSGSLKDI